MLFLKVRTLTRYAGPAILAGGLNILLAGAIHLLEVPLYFDPIATILVALHLGLLPAVVTAVVTHLLLGPRNPTCGVSLTSA
ncbi:MAG: hypothetical protein ACOCW6_04565, partial [Spirochaetota bacterium]